jgi:hypothetical protein
MEKEIERMEIIYNTGDRITLYYENGKPITRRDRK